MRNYVVQYGQSVFDLAMNVYGDISKVWDIVDDNNFADGLDTDLEGGQVVLLRDGIQLTANTITEYFNRYPAIINNSDYEDTGILGVLRIILKQIGNEDKGGDGFIIIDVQGGKAPFQFVWKNQDTDTIISTSQNLVAASAGTYSVTVVDSDGNEKSLTNLVISVVDNTVYLVDEFGNYITDENGNFIIVND
jgi:hypothetical protein